MSQGRGTLVQQSRGFAADLAELLAATLPDAPGTNIVDAGPRTDITIAGQTDKSGGASLKANGVALAWLRINMRCRLDHRDEWLAIDESSIWVVSTIDREPLIRFDYLRDPDTCPSSHVQVHAHRGALSHLLAMTRNPKPHMLSALHIPTGGSRFRPGVEDVLQFLIQDCGFDAVQGWQAAVESKRADFRRKQLRAAVRALPRDAAEALEGHNYQVIPPEGGHPPDKPDALTGW